MTVENISLSISTKVWGRAGIELPTPESAMGLAADWAGAQLYIFYMRLYGKR